MSIPYVQFEDELVDGLLPLRLHPVADKGSTNDDQCLNLLRSCSYVSYVKNVAQDLRLKETSVVDSNNLVATISDQVLTFLETGNDKTSRQLKILSLGIASLQLFVQANWFDKEMSEIEEVFTSFSNSDIIEALVLDGENVYPLVRQPIFLLLSRICFVNFKSYIASFKTSSWWTLRYLSVHQKVLEEPSVLIHESGYALIASLLIESFSPKLQLQLLIEIAYFHLLYHEVPKAQDALKKAEHVAQMDIVVTGALGKRTKFQQKDVAQLTVKCADLQIDIEKDSALRELDLPRDVSLDDEVRLNRVAFVKPEDQPVTDLAPLQQVIFLALASRIQKSHPSDSLISEEILPFLNSVLSQPKVWVLQASALLTRSRLESSHGRTVERSLMQVQEVLDVTKRHSGSTETRLAYFYASSLPPLWEIETQLADLLSSLGLTKEALDTFLRLQQWEKVIACYQLLQLRHRAEEIVRQELEKNATPKLWCLLGDCTDDTAYYEKAWELSKHRSARAQRDWGFLYYRKKKYEECISHFQKSLEVNYLQEGVWLRLAYSALELERWELAANAYRKYCSLESENSDAWNNVAKCYIKLGQKNRAWKALTEAVKCNYDSWRIWDNLMAVSADCGEFEEVIRCYHRLLDLKEKYVDVEVLKILVEAINSETLDSEGRNAIRLRDAALKLFGRLTAMVPNNAQIWKSYAILTTPPDSNTTAEVYFKAAQHWQKAYRSAVQDTHWEKEVDSSSEVLDIAKNLAAACLRCGEKPTTNTEATQLLGSCKLSLKSVVTKLKNYETTLISGGLPEDVRRGLSELEVMLEKIILCQQHLQGS